METKNFRWCFLLFALFASPTLNKAQSTAKDTTLAERVPLDLILRQMDVKDFNGSAYTISGDEIRNLPVTNLTNLLGGLIPGFYSRQTSGGMVDERPNFWLRGSRTYHEGVLVLVDGQERDFSILSPHEIESITVLKDAAGTVLYGMLGANGVILVNTRKGRTGKPSIELTAQLVNQQPVNLLKPLGTLDYVENYNKALMNDGMDETNMYSQFYLSNYRKRSGVNTEMYPDVDWMDDYFRKSSWLNRYNLNISGGSDHTRYFVNAGFLKQYGMFNTDNEFDYNTNNDAGRYNVRSNVEFDVTPSTMLAVDLYGWSENQNRPGGDSFGAYYALSVTPFNAFPAYYLDNGNYKDQSGNIINNINNKIVAGDGIHTNPWALLNRKGYATVNNTYISFRSKITQDFSSLTKGLKASVTLSMDAQTNATIDRTKGYAYYELTDFDNPVILKKTGTDGKMLNDVVNKNSIRRNTMEAMLSYERQFGLHNISALSFYNQYEYTDEVSIPSRFQGIGAWVGYNYNKRYGIDFLMNYQGAYKFAPGHQFGFFPAVSAGWTISNEPFFAGLKDKFYLKLKGSYGQLGSHLGVEEFLFMGKLNPTTNIYNFGNTMAWANGYVEDLIANPRLTWEKSEQSNGGIEIKLFNNQLSILAEYFRDNRTDMYMNNSRISSILGLNALINENIGEMYTKGFDAAMNWSSKIGKLKYSIGGTWSYSENKVTATGEADQPYPWLQTAGYSLGVKRGYIAEGFFNSYEEIAAAPKQTFSEVHPGDIRYKDVNKDGIIDTYDRVPIGYSDIPKIFYGINIGLSYKGFGINALFQGAADVSRMSAGRVAYPFFGSGNIYEHQLDTWSPEYQTPKLPILSTINSGGVNNTLSSTFWLRNADYIRLNTLEIYFDFPELLLKKSFIKNFRLFASGYNLFTWTNYDSPLDPQDDADAGSMPITRNLSLGCSIKF
jgi:TonB-linked SusC/RagA family outer membrane protein